MSDNQLKDFAIRCSCGALQGSTHGLSSDDGPRLICYCDDCQAFAHFLGRSEDMLDVHGGTDVFQFSPAHLRIEKGAGHLTCMRLKPNGLLRWYADCCRTPIGNTLATRHVPFVGLVNACIHLGDDALSLDGLLGPVETGVFGQFAKGDRTSLGAHDKAPFSLIIATMGKILKRRLRGDHRSSPFFDVSSGQPAAAPKILSEAERRQLEVRRLA